MIGRGLLLLLSEQAFAALVQHLFRDLLNEARDGIVHHIAVDRTHTRA